MLHTKIKLFSIGVLVLSFLGLAVYTGILPANLKAPPTTARLISNVAINCGSVGNLTALNGREWIGESALGVDHISGKSSSSVHVQTSSSGITVDPVPYKTSRISSTEFRYTFPVNPGQKIVRLHFYPASYRGFEKWVDYFSVKAGPFTLLRNYSASPAAQTSGLSYIVKEFCLNVEEGNRELTVTFSPSLMDKTYAFVNGIEIISMPGGLYYTPELKLGALIVGLSHRSYFFIDNGTALEVVHRFNVGGISINSMEDFGLFRQWDEDINFLLEPRGRRVRHRVLKYKNIPAPVAPIKIYQTSWKIVTGLYNTNYHLTWRIPVDLGFGYLVRLHFCELDYRMAERTIREFNVHINNQIAETWADVIRWSNEVGIPMYKDYVVILEEDDEGGGKFDITIRLESDDELVFGLLNGMEIFKLSNLENNLAASDIVYPIGLSTPLNPKNEKFSIANVIGNAMTVITILLSIVAYSLRKCCEEQYPDGRGAESASVELRCRVFSLAEIKLATQKFSDECVIGKGGFGKVYKGVIPGVPGIVAIKRLNLFSRQGANEFWAEIETLSKLRHIQLVSLIGYCNEFGEMILVYEYIPGGTLADNLYKFARKGMDCVPLSWEQRLRICIGAARGLEYLHTSGEYGIIHRDIKDTNILLDENLIAKISDFGLSKLEKVSPTESYLSTKVKGTVGYLDPNYITTHRLTRKSDVYSFGVVMLVVLSGKPAVEVQSFGEPISLLSRFQECTAEGDASRIVDPSLQGGISSDSLKRFVKTVENCLQLLPSNRPTMAKVVSSLERAIEKHQSHMNSELVDSNVETTCLSHNETKILEQIGTSPPAEVISEKQTENLASTSRDENSHETKILDGIVISPPAELNSKIPTENLASTSRGEILRPRIRDSAGVRKSLFSWPWIVGNGKENVTREPANEKTVPPIPGKSNDGVDTNGGSVGSREHRVGAVRSGVPQEILSIDIQALSLDELKKLTDNFGEKALIGEGSCGQVYMGTLSNGQKVAIKKMDESSRSETDSDFAEELSTVPRLKHEHLIELLGYWLEGHNRILAYEYATMGSLHDVLHGKKGAQGSVLNWNQRVKIAYGAAKGLEHLHEKVRPTIVHGRVSSKNVLLFDDFVPKIADFSLGTKPLVWENLWSPTSLVDSLELYGFGRTEQIIVTTKESDDIYNFGVVLLELLTGRKPIDHNRPRGQKNLITWATPRLSEDKVKQCVDPKLNNDYPRKGVAKMAAIAALCLQWEEEFRPTMSTVRRVLQGLLNSLDSN